MSASSRLTVDAPFPGWRCAMISVKGFVYGRVQGVGFRYFTRRQAQAEGLSGYAHNLADGRVEFLLQGEADAVSRVIEQLKQGPSYARVTRVEYTELSDAPRMQGFSTH